MFKKLQVSEFESLILFQFVYVFSTHLYIKLQTQQKLHFFCLCALFFVSNRIKREKRWWIDSERICYIILSLQNTLKKVVLKKKPLKHSCKVCDFIHLKKCWISHIVMCMQKHERVSSLSMQMILVVCIINKADQSIRHHQC